MKQRKGNPEHIKRIKAVKPAIARKKLAKIDLPSIYSAFNENSKIDDWFNRKPIKWRCDPCLSGFSLSFGIDPYIELSASCGKLSFYKMLYMKDHKTKSDLVCSVKKDIAFAQRVFNDYNSGLSSLAEAEKLLSDYKYPIKITKKRDELDSPFFVSGLIFVVFISVIGILISVGANQ